MVWFTETNQFLPVHPNIHFLFLEMLKRCDPGDTFVTSVPVNSRAIKHNVPKSQDFWCVFWGSFVPPRSCPCTWQLIWRPGGRSLDAALTDPAVLNRSDDESTEQMKNWKGDEERVRKKRSESGGWREGEHRSGASDLQGPKASHNIGPLLCPTSLFPASPPLLCHSGLDHFILIRLIAPKGKLLITSHPPTPPEKSILPLSSRTGGFALLDRKEECERWDRKEALTAAVLRFNEMIRAWLVW